MTNPNPNQDGIKETNFKNLSREERSEIARKGAMACNIKKKEKKTMKETVDYIMSKMTKNDDGEEITIQEAIIVSMALSAMDGNVKAATFLRDTKGEKPIEKVEFKPTEESIKEVEKLIEDGK